MSDEEELTRYDNPLITPTPDMLRVHFALLASVNGLVTISSLVLILGILRSKQVRSKAFNLYLLFMAIPDFAAALLCLITCAMGAYQSVYYSEWMCQFQSFYLTATFATNAWMNAVIVHEVYKLIRYSHARHRYFPPTTRKVFFQVAGVYTYGIAWGLLASVIPGLPVKPAPFYGLVCMPMEYDLPSSLFFYMAYVPGIMVLPMIYSAGVMIHILRKGLLPKTGRNRVISIFLLRLIALYFLFWLPCLLLKVIGNWIKINPWIPWAGSVLSHFQGLFSSLCAIATSDAIRHEVLMVLRCKCSDPPLEDSHGTMSKKVQAPHHTDQSTLHTEISHSWRSSWVGSPVPTRLSGSAKIMSKILESSGTQSGSSQAHSHQESHGDVDQDDDEDKTDLEAPKPQIPPPPPPFPIL